MSFIFETPERFLVIGLEPLQLAPNEYFALLGGVLSCAFWQFMRRCV